MEQQRTELEDAFGAFNRLSADLTRAYRELETRAGELAAELAHSRLEKARLADRLAVLLDSLPGGVVVLDEAGRVRECNAPARGWLGEDLSSRIWSDVIDASRRSRPSPDGEELLIDGGIELTVSRRFVPGRGETIILLTDVTERRRLQLEMERNRRLAAMGEMAARLAHQVRTPLSSALLYADHLTSRNLEPARRQRFGEQLMDCLRGLEAMTRDMLGFVRGGRGACCECSGLDLARAAIQALASRLDSQRRLNLVDAGGGTALVRCDEQAVVGALCNLVENAWQAAGDAGVVNMRLQLVGSAGLAFRVEDNGPGVSPDQRDLIFEPFYSARPGGTGLGLAVARSVAEAHDGTLDLDQSEVDGGACFVMTVPRVARSSRHRAEGCSQDRVEDVPA